MNTTPNNSLQLVTPPFVPVMDRKQFAQLVGVTDRVVEGWISRGYLPTIKFSNGEQTSKLTLINMIELIDQVKRGAI